MTFDRAGRCFDEEHYLGDLPAGRHLVQVVEDKGRWLALLDRGACAHRLEERDRWIGWSGQQRAERQGLVVMNRRFLALGRGRKRNPQSLGPRQSDVRRPHTQTRLQHQRQSCHPPILPFGHQSLSTGPSFLASGHRNRSERSGLRLTTRRKLQTQLKIP